MLVFQNILRVGAWSIIGQAKTPHCNSPCLVSKAPVFLCPAQFVGRERLYPRVARCKNKITSEKARFPLKKYTFYCEGFCYLSSISLIMLRITLKFI